MPEQYRLYLDQMFPLAVGKVLREQGYDVLRASDIGQARANDQQILGKAIAEDRILVTLDEHFGDWVILPLSKHHGVIRIKIHPTTSENILRILMPFLRDHNQEQFKDNLVILSEKRAKWIRTA